MGYHNLCALLCIGSNNTAELTAIGEALRWVKQLHGPGDPARIPMSSLPTPTPATVRDMRRLPIIINCDSTYAGNSVLGVFNGSKNSHLIRNIRGLLSDVQGALHRALFSPADPHPQYPQRPGGGDEHTGLVIAHVKGHSNHRWNDRADELANMGILGASTPYHPRPQLPLPVVISAVPGGGDGNIPLVSAAGITARAPIIILSDDEGEVVGPARKRPRGGDGGTLIRAIDLD